MTIKTCKKCKNQVDIKVKYCPKCGCNEFANTEEVVVVKKAQPSLVHSLFYWKYGEYYVLSKSKIGGIATLIFFVLASLVSGNPGAVIVTVILSAIVFLIGLCIHMAMSQPSKKVAENNDYGFVPDLIHFLFFWQNKNTGEHVISKTKIISHLAFILFTVAAAFSPNTNIFVMILVGLIFETPVFIIGYAIHWLINRNKTDSGKQISKPKELPKTKPAAEKPSEIINEYKVYKSQIEELIRDYNIKESHTRDLIEKRFTPPQLTYTRFISVVDKSNTLFTNQSNSALTMINLASDYSPKIENEIKSKIDILKQITHKLDDLTNELVLTMDKSDDEEINNLFDEMSGLISSVNDYE